jgi:protein phosphatase
VGKGTTLVAGDRSDVGCRRAVNQDSRAVLAPSGPEDFHDRGWVLLVADGMGAHAAGEEASRIAADRVPAVYRHIAHQTPPEALLRALRQANAEIFDKGETHPELRGMGTTCTVLVLVPRGVLLGHVGDSRAYRIRGRSIEQLSRDHSLAWECGLSAKEAAAIPKNIITRSMGPHPDLEPDLEGPHSVADGDVFLLCSDGLSGQVRDEEIGLLAGRVRDPSLAAEALIGLTLARGAPDNVTVVIARAGREEVTKTFAHQEPWPLTDTGQAAARSPRIPWAAMAGAAACFFVGLLVMPGSELVRNGSSFVQRMSPIAAAAAFLGTVACLCWGLFSTLSTENARQTSGKRASRGPYRTADCSPNRALLQHVVGSIEAAAASLAAAERDRTTELTSRAREAVAAERFDDAVAAAAEALAALARNLPRGPAAAADSASDRSADADDPPATLPVS